MSLNDIPTIKKIMLVSVAVAFIVAMILIIRVYSLDSAPVEVAPSSESVTPESEPPPESESAAPEPEEEEVDLALLKEQNPDTLGYIEVPGTVISYPVMRGVDNMKYLTTNFEGEYDAHGAVFADMFNGDSLTGPLTILYAHYTPDDTFFTQLHRYDDVDYLSENPDMTLYTESGEREYEIVAAFTNDNYNLLYEKDYSDPAVMQGFIDHILQIDPNAIVKSDAMGVDDDYLLLSTCMNSYESVENRFIVVGKLK